MENGAGGSSAAAGSAVPAPPPAAGTRSHMGDLPTTVGQGEYEQPLMEAVLQGMRDMAVDIQELKAANYDSWELPPDSDYVTECLTMKDQYVKDCREKKGTNIGDMKNYVFFGLMKALTEDKRTRPQAKAAAMEIIGKRMKNSEGEFDLTNAKKLGDLVGHCQVIRTKNRKKAFANIMIREGEEGSRVETLLFEALMMEGTRQWDSAPPKPVHKNLRDALTVARGKKK